MEISDYINILKINQKLNIILLQSNMKYYQNTDILIVD